MLQKIVVGVMLQHKETVGQQQIFFKNQVGNGVDRRQCIGWPGEDVVELRAAVLDEMKDVHLLDPQAAFNIEYLRRLAHETHRQCEIIHVGHILATPRNELIAVAARAAEQIEYLRFLEIDQVVEDVEQGFLGHIRRWAGGPVIGRRIEAPAL